MVRAFWRVECSIGCSFAKYLSACGPSRIVRRFIMRGTLCYLYVCIALIIDGVCLAVSVLWGFVLSSCRCWLLLGTKSENVVDRYMGR